MQTDGKWRREQDGTGSKLERLLIEFRFFIVAVFDLIYKRVAVIQVLESKIFGCFY